MNGDDNPLHSSLSSRTLKRGWQHQPTEVVTNILSYLEQLVGDRHALRYINKQWFNASRHISETSVRWASRYPSNIPYYVHKQVKMKQYSFELALRQYPRATSFINFPLDDAASLLKDQNFLGWPSLRSISLTWKGGIKQSIPLLLLNHNVVVVFWLCLCFLCSPREL
jgi:hypothetical protein